MCNGHSAHNQCTTYEWSEWIGERDERAGEREQAMEVVTEATQRRVVDEAERDTQTDRVAREQQPVGGRERAHYEANAADEATDEKTCAPADAFGDRSSREAFTKWSIVDCRRDIYSYSRIE